MCILLLAHRHHPAYDLVVAANRDEFHARPSAPASFWADHPNLLAGRDLEAGGTWLGVNRKGSFSAVTNLRGAGAGDPARSRGHLVRDFLLDEAPPPAAFAARLVLEAARYAGCNLVFSGGNELYCWSPAHSRELPPGIHGISNAPLEEEWPKVLRLKRAFEPLRRKEGGDLARALLEVLQDEPEAPLPDRAQKPAAARLEESIFVRAPAYGTRCSSVVLRDRRRGRLTFVERRYDPEGRATGEFWQELQLLN